MELIVGDAVISNPFRFNIGTVTLKFPELAAIESAEKGSSYKQKPNVYTTKPEIKVIYFIVFYIYYLYMPMLVSDKCNDLVTSKTLAENHVKVNTIDGQT